VYRQVIITQWLGPGFTFVKGDSERLVHGGEEDESVPRLVEALLGRKVVGAAAGFAHTVVWTEAGELFTFGEEGSGNLCGRPGHDPVYGGKQDELVPRLVEALVGEKGGGRCGGFVNRF